MTQRRDLQALIDAAPVGKMQWRVIICCFLVVMLDGFDTAAIGFIAPDIRTHWQLSAGDLAPLFGAGLLGLTAGALLSPPSCPIALVVNGSLSCASFYLVR